MRGVEHRQHKGLNIVPSCRTNRRGSENGRCAVTSLPGMRNVFYRHMGRLTTSSGANATACRRSSTNTFVLKRFRSGTKSPM
jgi:hypothetical protein